MLVHFCDWLIRVFIRSPHNIINCSLVHQAWLTCSRNLIVCCLYKYICLVMEINCYLEYFSGISPSNISPLPLANVWSAWRIPHTLPPSHIVFLHTYCFVRLLRDCLDWRLIPYFHPPIQFLLPIFHVSFFSPLLPFVFTISRSCNTSDECIRTNHDLLLCCFDHNHRQHASHPAHYAEFTKFHTEQWIGRHSCCFHHRWLVSKYKIHLSSLFLCLIFTYFYSCCISSSNYQARHQGRCVLCPHRFTYRWWTCFGTSLNYFFIYYLLILAKGWCHRVASFNPIRQYNEFRNNWCPRRNIYWILLRLHWQDGSAPFLHLCGTSLSLSPSIFSPPPLSFLTLYLL